MFIHIPFRYHEWAKVASESADISSNQLLLLSESKRFESMPCYLLFDCLACSCLLALFSPATCGNVLFFWNFMILLNTDNGWNPVSVKYIYILLGGVSYIYPIVFPRFSYNIFHGRKTIRFWETELLLSGKKKALKIWGNTRRKVDFLQDQLTKRDFTVSCNMALKGFLWILGP